MSRKGVKNHTIWVNEQDRIASFHLVEGYQAHSFQNMDFFLDYVYSLQERGFRFQ